MPDRPADPAQPLTAAPLHTIPSLYGPLAVPPWPEDLIVRALQAHGEWGAAETELLAPVLPDAPVVWDLGAFLGSFSLGLARHHPLARVLAVEANPRVLPCLARNLDRLLACPARALHAGVGGRAGWLVPRARPDAETNHGAQDYDLVTGPAGPAGAVPCRTLPELRAEHGDYDMLKLDLEGLETEVLQGDRAYIAARQPVIWAECNEDRASLALLNALAGLGYAPVYLAFPAFRRANFNRATDLIYPLAYEAGLLAGQPDLLARLTGRVAGEEIITRPLSGPQDLRRALFDTPRWGKAEWAGMSRPELIARLGRLSQGQGLADFLDPPGQPEEL